MDECNLAQRAVQGDREAFGELVQLHQTGVYNAAYRMTGNRQEAEDIAQEAFLRAFRSIRTLDPARPPGPWFRKIAVNVCLNQYERHPARKLNEETHPSRPTSDPGPETQTVEREHSRQVRSALLMLPLRYRAVLELRHFEELTYAEIAELLNRPLSDVKSDLFRARRALAKHLKELA
jgi:RNA polymerase sigma-70 factor, ECF subfamily